MKEFFEDYENLGLPGGPNELKRFTNGFIISERGQWDYPGQPTAVPTPSGRITMEGVEDDLLGIDNLGNTQYMTPGNEYQFEGDMVYEIPQAKRGGSKKPSKKYSRSLMAKNRLFAKNALFKKKKSAKNKIFDPNSPYFQPGGETDAMNAMMKARLAYANEFGNPSAQRMIVIPDQPYDFGDGNYGTHYMASIDNYAVPQIQSVNGVLQIGDYGPESSEAIRFDSDEDANYFAENYKSISPGFMEVELDDNEIEEYRRGGYIVEDISIPTLTRMDDGGTNTCPPDHYWNGEACVPTGRTYTPIDPNYLAQHPDEARRIINEGEVSIEREGSDIGKLRAEFREKNPMDIFLDEKKRQFLKKNKGLNKSAGVTMEKFPEDVLQNFMKEYEYKTNNYAVNKLGKKEGWNPKRRGEWVDELTPGERDAVAESKYGSKLQPSYWSRSLAGLQELGNEAIKLLPGEQGDVMKFNIPGLTKKEQKEIRESKLGALETLAPMDIPGAAIANLAKNTGLTTGSDYKEQANALAGEKMANVTDIDALALNPLTYAGLESLPELGISLARGLGKGANKLQSFVKNARDLEKMSKAYNPNLTKAGFSLDMFSKPKPKVDFIGPMRAPAEAVKDVLISLRKRGSKWDAAGAKGEELLHPDMINYHGTYAGRPIVEVRMPDGTPEFFYKSSGWAGKSSKDGKTTAGMWQPFGGFSDTPATTNWFIKDATELTVDGIKYKPKTVKINGESKSLSAFDQLRMPEYNHTGRSLDGYELIDQGKIAVDKPGYELYYGSKAYKGMAENLDNALMQKLGFKNTDELENAFNFQNRNAAVDSYTPIRKYGGAIAKYGHSVGNLIRKDDGGSVSGTQGLTADFSQRLTQMILDARAQGIDLSVGSGYRSYEKQKRLWEQALKKYGSPEKARKWVAPPGGSFHNKGLAVDLNANGQFLGKDANSKATEWAHANAKKYGLHFRMGHEPWHIEPIEKTKSNSEKENEHDHDHGDEVIVDKYGAQPDITTKEEQELIQKNKDLEFKQKQAELAEQERQLHDDDYSDWTPGKDEFVDPSKQMLEEYSKIIAPSNQNMFAVYNANLQGKVRDGGIIVEVGDNEIEELKRGGYIVEEID